MRQQQQEYGQQHCILRKAEGQDTDEEKEVGHAMCDKSLQMLLIVPFPSPLLTLIQANPKQNHCQCFFYTVWVREISVLGFQLKMATQEGPELPSSRGHTKSTATHGTIPSENK